MHMHYCIRASKNFQVILVSFPELRYDGETKGGLAYIYGCTNKITRQMSILRQKYDKLN